MTIMIRSKVLSDAAWKDVLAKNKAVKDNGMLKALSDIKKLGEDDHESAQKTLEEIVKLTAQLKKSKETSASPAVAKFLGELSAAADTAMRDVAKAKAEAEKKARTEADAKKDADKKSARDADAGTEDESAELLTTKMVPLLRQVQKGDVMHVLIARAGKQVAVLLSRKPISPARRELLAQRLGVSGGVKYFVGHCLLEEGTTTFVMKGEVAGLAKQLKLALFDQTGLRVKRLSCRGEDGDADHDLEEPDAEDPDSAKDDAPRFVPGVDVDQTASGDGDEDAGRGPAAAADTAKPPSPALASAPEQWDGTRDLLESNIAALKRAVQSQVADESEDFIADINDHLQKLDRILGKLDRRLTDSLATAAATRDAGRRRQALDESKAILAEYIRYVRSEPLIDHLDKNPFGVKTDLKVTLSTNLAKLARAIG